MYYPFSRSVESGLVHDLSLNVYYKSEKRSKTIKEKKHKCAILSEDNRIRTHFAFVTIITM